MKVLTYNELNSKTIPGFAKLKKYLEDDDFKSADVKKVGDNLYRARLNQRDRLLFSIYRHQEQNYALLLEFIKNHAYQDSRFLRQVSDIDEDKIPLVSSADETGDKQLVYLNPSHTSFNLLDKIISFDDRQQSIFDLQPPLIVIGSAGSGKTALTLEKMKQAVGDVLYVTQSAYLVKNSRDLYYANHYDNPDQQIDFLSFQEFLESIRVPAGKPITFQAFQQWFSRFRQGQLKDAHKLFEEFRGVITGPATDKSWLSREDYLNLGVKESIFLGEERGAVYDIFEKYLSFLQDNHLYDSNIVSHQHLQHVQPRYDFVIVDEVQDLTNIQLYLIIKSLRQAQDFILCGDSNQIVHPNFFSWSKVKSLFYRQEDIQTSDELIRILNTNYRNSPQVTEIANKILKIKNQRFGSIDKESHYLVESNGHTQGEVLFLQDTAAIRQELDSKTKASTLFAVIVMTVDQKPAAQQYFNTPLVFTIQEAKGLEYENIILYNFLSQEEARYREISKGVMAADLELDIKYARAKDKTDKSLEVYKFYINALYVAITRAVKNLYWIESSPKQSLLDLLGLRDAQDSLQLANQNSSLDAWRQEAHKLELQGKQEQAERIRSEILKQKTPPWQVINAETLLELKHNALEGNDKAAKMTLFEYALVYEDRDIINSLLKIEFKAAKHPDKGLQLLQQKHYSIYSFKKPDAVLKQVDQYGPDFRNIFNQTPLMVAAWVGNIDVIKALFELGADTEKADGNGLTAFQIALAQTERSESYAKKKLADIYELLEPTSMSIQVDGRLVKLDKNSMEFFLLNVMIALFYRVMPKKMTYRVEGFSTQDFLEAVQHIPNSVLPERRKQRAYLSSILAKNEVSKEDKYNRKLFYRVIRGAYILNPNLAIKVEDEWVNIYDLLVIDRLTPQEEAFSSEFLANYNELARALATPSKDVLKKLIAEKRTDQENTHE
ncbi:MAG: ankyrin repeat domain-containing protein [Methylobacter sp.]|nr:ankyrin repeat domain-containing protein [Methylobacter sp.]MDP2429874.1 ankyrin repeat domain-containing protein [Methylobacter sp.]MDP3056061.1 ankyrin repeat domain-containing protein [Methylobacter sp.]MDP3362831.1 ankyrin repeat domain-containing protein [Methylobacter sp.]MDZ4219855.1 ankyrin repeat domain-containing protein [Methylobacter sp.]